MAKIVDKWESFSPQLRSVLRILAAFTYMSHGTMKLFAFPAAMMPGAGGVHLFSEIGLAGIIETFGGALLLLGLFTRPVAFIVAGEMAVAFFQVHFPRSFWPVISGGELAYLYCFIWLYISAAGAGPWSIDALIKKNRKLKEPGQPHHETRSANDAI